MIRWALPVLLVVVLTAITASAASLSVDGGTLHVFTQDADIDVPATCDDDDDHDTGHEAEEQARSGDECDDCDEDEGDLDENDCDSPAEGDPAAEGDSPAA